MRIGILTLHDSTNYGANLQTYALYKVIQSLGHDVVLIDRRRSPQGLAIGYPFSSEPLPMRMRRLLGLTGVLQEKIHALNTYLFQRGSMRISSYHFHDWKDVPKDMGIDLMVVGSDQIWNKRINDPLDYMPARFPKELMSITYAASMGMPEIPQELMEAFKTWIPKFRAVSVREPNLQAVLARIGIESVHVADPVVLFGVDEWRKFVGNVAVEKDRVFVYAFWGDVLGLKKGICRWAKGRVDFFPCRYFARIPSFRHPKSILSNVLHWIRLLRVGKVRVRLMAGPKAYMHSLIRSEAVITNSFHGFVLGVMLDKNVRYVVPRAENKFHSDMLDRIMGYADKFVSGPLLQPSWDAAFASVGRGERIKVDFAGMEKFRQESLNWLHNAINAATR